MSEKKVGKRLLTWVLVLVMTLSLLPLNVLADEIPLDEPTGEEAMIDERGNVMDVSLDGIAERKSNQKYATWWPVFWDFDKNSTIRDASHINVTAGTGNKVLYTGGEGAVSARDALDAQTASAGNAVKHNFQVVADPGYYVSSYRIVCGNYDGCGVTPYESSTPVNTDGNYTSAITVSVKADDFCHFKSPNWLPNYYLNDNKKPSSGKYDLLYDNWLGNKVYPFYLLIEVKQDTARYQAEYKWGELDGKLTEIVPASHTDLLRNSGFKANAPSEAALEAARNLGYKFLGWKISGTGYTDTDVVFSGNAVTIRGGNLELIAQWEKTKFTVTYEYTGAVPEGAPAAPAPEPHTCDESVTVAAVSAPNGYRFTGWVADDIVISDGMFTMPAKDVKFTGSFVKDESQWATVNYVIDGGHGKINEGAQASFEVLKGTAWDSTKAPATEPELGYKFNGWDKNPDKITENTVITGSFVKDDTQWATVNYVIDGGHGKINEGAQASFEVLKGTAWDSTKAPATEPELGYKFNGWDKNPDKITENTVITGSFVKDDTQWATVNYVIDGGHGKINEGAQASFEVLKGTAWDSTKAPATEPELGYKFNGWDKNPDKITENTVITGSFVKDDTQWATVNYVIDGGHGKINEGAQASFEVLKGTAWDSTKAPATEPELGYKFNGWDKNPDKITENTVITGSFVKDDTQWATVNYVIDGGHGKINEGAQASFEVLKGTAWDSTKAPATEPELGYKFNGWDKNPDKITENTVITGSFVKDDTQWATVNYVIDGGHGKINEGAQASFEVLKGTAWDSTKAPATEPELGYKFNGWDKNPDKITENTVITGSFVKDDTQWATVNYVIDGGHGKINEGAQASFEVLKGTAWDSTKAPATEPELGYKFNGWDKNPDKITENTVITGSFVKDDTQWATVNYVIDGGHGKINEGAQASFEVLKGTAWDSTKAPATEPELGYKFNGWDKNPDKITENTVITGSFVKDDTQWATVNYVIDGGHGKINEGAQASFEVLKGTAWDSTKAPATEPELGYKFNGWDKNPDKITENTVITGSFVKDESQWATVNYVIDGGHGKINEGAQASFEVLKGTAWDSTKAPATEPELGYKFNGWDKNPDKITENTVITGSFVKDDTQWATVNYVIDGGHGKINEGAQASFEVLKGTAWDSTKAPATEPELGYKFNGWDKNPDKITENTVITGSFVKDESQWATVNYVIDGGHGKINNGAQASFEVLKGTAWDSTKAPATEPELGYKFNGWDKNPDKITENTVITGSFVKDDTQWATVNYVIDGGHGKINNGAQASFEVLKGTAWDSTKAPATEPELGYKFNGWDKNPEKITENTVITGTFVKDDTKWFTVTFNSNGGSTVPSQTVKYNAKAKEPPAPTKSGYTFAGWYTDNEKFTTKYDFATPVTKDIPLYAKWTRNYTPRPYTPPTVVIPDDDALGLNTTDHFAYIVGYGNGEVRPQNNITRAEVATIFFRLLTDDVRDENLTKTNRYSDVAATSWYNTAVSTLSSMGIITGYPDGTFRPNAAITRAEFAAIAARFDNDGDKTAAKFSDIATHWAKDEISIAYNNGWITGYPNGTFGPQRDITRAETMTLVNRVLNRQPETEDDLLPNMMVWTDNANPKAWYYLAVQEATNSHYYKFKTNSKYEKWTELRETRDWTQLEK